MILRKRTLTQTLTALILSLLFTTIPMIATAQNYYPAEIGNEWILDSTDGKERQTYTLEVPEDDADKELILLKIETKNLNNNKVIDTDKYFLTDEHDSIKLHRTILQQQVPTGKETVTANFPTPVTFFPKHFEVSDMWNIVADTELLELPIKSTTKLEVVDFEDVVTSVGTFYDCAKIELELDVDFLGININIDLSSTSFQWLAPGVGPVKFQNNDGDVYEITSFKRSPPPIIPAQNPPVWSLPSLDFQVTGTRIGGILNAKILENVEDYVSEPDKLLNLGIASVTGNIVHPGDGTGFATNLQRKQDLWVAGIFENAPIVGRITLFAENSKGRTTQTIDVRINVSQ